MKIPLSLLKEYLPIDHRPLSEISEALVSLGIEVDGIEGKEPVFSGVVAAQVKRVTPHPQTDKLQIVHVSIGEKTYQVVCGDLTVKTGEMVSFAPVGATIKGVSIQKRGLRGETSEGMLTSAKELGIYDASSEVLRLDETFSLGQDLRTTLHDPIFVCSLTPNLGHCQSVLGVARELSAYFQIPLHPTCPKASYEIAPIEIEDPEDCSRYSWLVLEDIPETPSPFWLRSALEKGGFSPSFLLVDLVNYVLLMTGQPMHAFSDAVYGKALAVKRVREETPFLGVDGETRVCASGALGVYAEDQLIALGGILGGKEHSVEKNTRSYLIEAAHFSPEIIRKTSRKMHLRSESSARFEKSVDPSLGPDALFLLASLVEKITGKTIQAKIQSSSDAPENRKVLCRKSRVEKLLGVPMSLNEMEDIFARLDCSWSLQDDETLEVIVPTYRLDLVSEIDLIEEIARFYGFEHLTSDREKRAVSIGQHDPLYLFSSKMRERALRLSFDECITPDLISHDLAKLTEEVSLRKKDLLETLYAKSEDHAILRSTFLGSFLQILSKRVRLQNANMQIFEMGKVHLMHEDQPAEKPVIAFMTSGENAPSFWGKKTESHDFFSLKGKMETLLSHFDHLTFAPSKHPSLHPTRQADIYLAGEDIGVIGEVHPKILASLSIKQKAFFAELHVDPLYQEQKGEENIRLFSPYPCSTRDWTIPIEKKHTFSFLAKILERVSSSILESAQLISVFSHQNTGKNHYTIRFTYRSFSGTLSLEEIEKEHAQIQKYCEEEIQKNLSPA
ncbi:MAG: phenylalanine--tRNA ligase subunit beta [Chlamydiota bacterium]